MNQRTVSIAAALGVGAVLLAGAVGVALSDTTQRVDLAVPDVGVRDLDGRDIDLRHGDWIVNVWLPG